MSQAGIAAVAWLVAAVVLFVIESATYQMLCIWFSIGAVLAMLVAAVGAPVWLQLVVFLVSSIGVLIVARPLVKNRLKVKKSATNADRVIGQVGIVKEDIDNELETGRVLVGGLEWMARNEGDGVIPADSRVTVERIEGVKLMVRPQRVTVPMERE